MLALWIILGILALLALLLVLPLRIYLKYDVNCGLRYRVKYLFLTLADSEAPEKPEQPEQPVKKAAETGKKRSGSGAAAKLLSFLGLEDVSSAANAKKALNEKGLAEMIRGVFGAVKALFSRISRLVCHGEFRRFDLRIVVGDTDCADAAMNYGELCAAVYPLLAFLESKLKFHRRNVELRCDFSAESTEAVFDGQLNYRPVYLLGFLLGLVGQYLKQDKKKGRT